MWSEVLTFFSLGNTAILTNVCLLPLYPGLIAFLAGNAANQRSRRATGLLGVLVLFGVVTMIMALSVVVFTLGVSFNPIFPVLLPIIYATVIIFGGLMLLGRNPFERLSTLQAPVLDNPYASAFAYGLLLGPMTLPCVGPTLTSLLIVGVGSASGLVESMLLFFAFALGFGWPLVVLPLIALPAQRRFFSWMTRNHMTLTRVSGILLIGIGVFGVWTEFGVRVI